MYAEFNSIVLFTVLYSRFQHCVSKVTILEYCFSTAEQKIKLQDKNFYWIMNSW